MLEGISSLSFYILHVHTCMHVNQTNLEKISHVKRKNKGQALRGQSNYRAITREIRK